MHILSHDTAADRILEKLPHFADLYDEPTHQFIIYPCVFLTSFHKYDLGFIKT